MVTRKAKGKTRRDSMRNKAQADARDRASRGAGGSTLSFPEGRDIAFLKIRKGTMRLDIIPYVASNNPLVKPGELWYKRSIKSHFNVGPESRTMLCPKTLSENAPCPVCEDWARARKDTNMSDKEVNELKPKERDLFNVIDLDDKEKGIQLWEVSYYNFGQLLDKKIDTLDPDDRFFGDLVEGCSIKVGFDEKSWGSGKPFLEAWQIEFKDREDYTEDILDRVFPLDEMLKIPTYEEIEKAHFGVGDGDEEVPEEQPAEDERKTKGRATREESTPTECPEDGGKWGVDFDELEECADCSVWRECKKALASLKDAPKEQPAEDEKAGASESKRDKPETDRQTPPPSRTTRQRRTR